MNKEQLAERIAQHVRKLKRDELVSLVDRLDGGTLKLNDLTLSGEGGFGFQEEVRDTTGAGGGSDDDDEDGGILERGADAGRGLLERAKGVLG
jgi:hypothetical protein